MAMGGITKMTIGLSHFLTVAAILFVLGIFGIFLNRKNVYFRNRGSIEVEDISTLKG